MDRPFHRHPAEISFRDTDASGWMHFTSAFHHVEMAEHACLRTHGLLVFARDQGGWPRVHLTCDFHRPLLGGDNVEVQLAIKSLGTSSVTWRFEILTAAGDLAVSGTLVTVRVDACGRPQPLSDAERAALEPGRTP
jgi:acyl-CoA thioester hydrolase